jgi:hypothetical protein
MNKRYVVNYIGDPKLVQAILEGSGARVSYNNHSDRVAIASIPESAIEQIRGLEGIKEVREDPL